MMEKKSFFSPSSNLDSNNSLLKPGDLILEKYKIINKLGAGGMNSTVYSGINTTLNRNLLTDSSLAEVAIKVVKRSSEMKENNWIKFLDELVTASRVQHVNLVQTFDVAQPFLDVIRDNKIVRINDVAVIVMENIKGPSLGRLIKTKGYFSVDEAMYFFKKMVLAIRRLHNYSHMIIHRDLKPDNILLSQDLRVLKIVDFGISSSVIMDALEAKTITNEQSLFGTVEYMSPDNLSEEIDKKTGKKIRKTPTPQFDFYALGVILFEMLTGEKPFIRDEKDDKKTILKAKYFDMPIMRGIRYDIPNSIENIVFKCIASKREDLHYRYKSCDELLNDIETYNKPERINEPLLKPTVLRVLEREDSFNPQIKKNEEKFWYKKWFFWIITTLFIILSIIVITLSILNFTTTT